MTNPTADAAKLLPCPFCGGEAVLEKCEGIVKGDVRWSAGCVERDGRELCMGYQSLTTYARQAEAITAWNTRPQPAPPEGEPDFAALACQIGFEHDEEWSELEISYGGVGRNINRERLIEIIKTLAERMYRLGLAARQ